MLRPLVLLISVLAGIPLAAAASSSFATCWLMWEGPDDLGYTFTFNQYRRQLEVQLEASYPLMTVQSYGAFNVGYMTSDQANATVFDFIQNKRCNVIISADTYLLPYVYYLDGGVTLAKQYPNVSWVLMDDFRALESSGLPNLLWGTTTWGRSSWIAGATAAVQAADAAVCVAIAYETGYLVPAEVANGFIVGTRSVNKTKPIYVMTMNNWFWDGAEQLAASLLNKIGCKVIARFLDARLIDIWVNAHPETGMLSIGAHADVGAYVGDGVMMSNYEDMSKLFNIMVTVIATGSIGSSYYPLVFPVAPTPLSPLASTAALQMYSWALVNAPDANHIICGPMKLHSGATVNYTQPSGCLSVLERPQEYIYDVGTTYYTFENGLDCPNATYYEYSFPDLSVTCHPCPANTYRPPQQTAASTSCTPCPTGFISDPGASICRQPQSSNNGVADAWYAFLIAGLVVVGALATAAVRQYRAYAVLAVRPRDPETAFAVCFIGLKNEHELQELGDTNMQAALEKLNAMIRSAAREHGCFEARRIDAGTVMVVSKTATDLVLFAETVMEHVVTLDWRGTVLVHQIVNPGVHASRAARHGRLRRHSKDTSSTHSKQSLSKRSRQSQAVSMRLRQQQQDGAVGLGGASSSTLDSDRHSSNISINLATIVPTIYAGLHFGMAQIEVDDEQNTISYHGHTIKLAAAIADAAVAGQILMSADMAEAVDLEHVSRRPSGKFIPCGTRMQTTVVSYQSARLGDEHHRIVAKAAARVSEAEEGVLGNALAKAEGRLMRRRVAVISCHVPHLARDFHADDNGIVSGKDVLEDIAEVAAENFGEIHAVNDGIVTVTVGARRPVSLLPSRAAAIAHNIVQHCSSVGVHIGPAVVGNTASGSSVVLGRISTTAAALRLTGSTASVKTSVSGSLYADLFPSHYLVTVDAFVLPWHSEKITRVVALCGARENGEAEEWLYSFEKESLVEQGWTHLIDKKDHVPQHEIDAIAKATYVEDGDHSDDGDDTDRPVPKALWSQSKNTLLRLLEGSAQGTPPPQSLLDAKNRLREHTRIRLGEAAAHAINQATPSL